MTEAAFVCVNHPDRDTTLRCNRCGDPICVSCAVRTPVGYRCSDCVRSQQAGFDTAGNLQLAVAGGIAAIGAGMAAALLGGIGFFGLLLAPVAGGGIAEAVRWAVRGARHRRLPRVAAAGAAAGVLAYGLVAIGPRLLLFGFNLSVLASTGFSLLWPLATGALIIGTIYRRLRGIRL